jgi:hypothetical protein
MSTHLGNREQHGLQSLGIARLVQRQRWRQRSLIIRLCCCSVATYASHRSHSKFHEIFITDFRLDLHRVCKQRGWTLSAVTHNTHTHTSSTIHARVVRWLVAAACRIVGWCRMSEVVCVCVAVVESCFVTFVNHEKPKGVSFPVFVISPPKNVACV